MMKKRSLNTLVFSLALLAWGALAPLPAADAKDTPYIPVGKARTKKTLIAIAPSLVFLPTGNEEAPLASRKKNESGNERKITEQLEKTIRGDLEFMGLFHIQPRSDFKEKAQSAGLKAGEFKFEDWKGTEILVKMGFSLKGSTIILESYLYDVIKKELMLAKRYKAGTDDVKILGHNIANDLVEKLTGLPGIFLTKIAMSCDRTGKKEIYVMNFDGSDLKQVTHHRSIAFAPAWSPDGSKIAYSLYTRHKGNVKNIDLYEFDFRARTIRPLSRKKGINSGAAYSPDGKTLALTMSYLGNPEIFTLDLGTLKTQQVTHTWGFDVDPNWSPDGKELVFSSTRSGQPMIYRAKIQDGKPVGKATKLTYAGRYNAAPHWSLQNNKITFAGWKDKTFDIFIMNPDGTKIERLTKNQGKNEDPYFSPDGNFIVFSSDRADSKNIYVMNIDGTFVKRLTYGAGNCVAPKWSNPP